MNMVYSSFLKREIKGDKQMYPVLGILFFILICVCWIFLYLFWFKAIVSIMATDESELPGKYDKIAWVLLFIFVPVFAPFIYNSSVDRFNDDKS